MGFESQQIPLRLGITIGDPAGIGPEIILKALAARTALPKEQLVLFGSSEVLKLEDQRLQVLLPRYRSPLSSTEIVDVARELSFEEAPAGKGGDSRGATLQWEALQEAMRAAKTGEIDGIVTAPWNKELFTKIDRPVVGHTEVLAQYFEVPDVVMMLGGDSLRVALVTIHIPLAEVAAKLSVERILTTAEITIRGLEVSMGISKPRVALAALNPHGGEGGHMGLEEEEIIIPALEELRRRHQEVTFTGPLPADTLFAKYRRGEAPFDVVIAMYHDQGLIPLKLLHFGESANVTLGLPVVRTSVDHGTAYDIAGQGIADAGSLGYAIELAAKMVGLRRRSFHDRGVGEKGF